MTEYGNRDLGGTFGHAGVATAYEHRAPYPPQVFEILTNLIVDEPRVVLDLGAGDGALARPLASRVLRVDALDVSAEMIGAGKRRPGGDQSNLHWIVGAAETADLAGPYALVTAGASLHWMEWETTMRRLVEVMTAEARLAVVEHGPRGLPWQEPLTEIIRRHSRSDRYDPRFDIVDALSERGVFEPAGRVESEPVGFRQSVGDYVEQFHSTASLAREHMSATEAEEFDLSVAEVVRPYAIDGVLDLPVVATVSWGRPLRSRE